MTVTIVLDKAHLECLTANTPLESAAAFALQKAEVFENQDPTVGNEALINCDESTARDIFAYAKTYCAGAAQKVRIGLLIAGLIP